MAWKPKTIAGKILKGAVIAGGSVLALATGTKIIGAATKVVGGVIQTAKAAAAAKGTTVLSEAGKTVTSGIAQTVDKVTEGAANLVSGITKDQRALILQEKAETATYNTKLITMDKLIKAGASATEARAQAGLEPADVQSFEGEKIQAAGMFDFLQNKNVLYIGAALIAMFLFSKKRR